METEPPLLEDSDFVTSMHEQFMGTARPSWTCVPEGATSGSLGPTIAQLWAEFYLNNAGVRVKLLADDEEDAAATKSTIIAITDEDEVEKAIGVTDSKDLAWPEDLKIQGFAVSLQATRRWAIHWGNDPPKKRSRSGAMRLAEDHKTRSFNTHDAVECVVDGSEQDAEEPDWRCYITYGMVVRFIVMFEMAKQADDDDDTPVAFLNENGQFNVSEFRIDVMFCSPSVPTLYRVRGTVVSHAEHAEQAEH
tara:strand:+ start:150 stop:896 length:747 start_codon:yes stop_codon:yes gene_type:complete